MKCHNKIALTAALFSLGFFASGCEHSDDTSSTHAAKDPGRKAAAEILAQKGDQNPQAKKGVEFMLAGDFRQANQAFNSALLNDQTNPWLHYLNGLCYQLSAQKGDAPQYDLAQVGFEQALKYDPTNVQASLQLARLFADKKDFGRAQEEYANVLILDPAHKEASYELARVSYNGGNVKLAHASIKRAAQLMPDRPEVLQAKAMILAAAGKADEAMATLANYQKVAKNDAKVAQTKRRINDWNNLYAQGLVLAQEAAPDTITDDVPAEDPAPGDPAPGDAQQPAAAAAPAPAAAAGIPGQGEMVVLDAVVLRVSEIGTTTKGNNILNNFTLGISPGNYGRGWSKALNNGASPTQTIAGAAAGFTGVADGGSNTRIFNQGISFGTINYNLNIANAVRQYIEIVGRPSLVASVGKAASFFSGKELTLGLTGQYSGSIQKIPVGSTLKVTPTALKNGMVSLDVSLYGSIIPDLDVANADPTNKWTNIGLSKVATTVEVPLGHTVMLGGITERIDIHQKSGFPILQDLPGIQYLFSEETTDSERKSVMYLITPRSYNENREKLQKITEFCKDRQNMKELESRNKNWFDPDYNMVVTMKHLSPLYREFRNGDLDPVWWNLPEHLDEQVDQIVSFLYY
ncbi:MAG: tetratricopeptide repeat protein [Proteobacteria bacterium]|nr:tetratricopeptide repeat protein [Pseudomonadota bacterium]